MLSVCRPALLALALCLCLPSPAAPRGRSLGWSLDAVCVRGLGDSLSVSLTWTFTDWNVDAAKAVVLSPQVRNGDHVVTLRPVSVYGRRSARTADRLVASGNRAELPVVDLSRTVTVMTEDVFPRSEWMDTLRLVLSVSEWSRRGGLVLRSTSQRGVYVRPPRPAEPSFPWHPLEPVPDGARTRELLLSAPVSFAAGSQRFDASLQSGEGADALRLFASRLKALSSSKRYRVLSSEIAVTAAPSGDPKAAAKLTRGRASSVSSYLRGQGAFRVSSPALRSGGEDWDGVRDWVEASPYRGDARLAEILSLGLGSGYVYSTLAREKPAVMDALREECFPSLSRVWYRASVRAPSFAGPGFVRPVFEELPELLSAWDFWYLSTGYDRADPRWLDATLEGASLRPEDARLSYNAVMGLLDRGEVRAAAVYLRNVPLSSDDGKYAAAAWMFRTGQYADALDCLEFLKGHSAFFGQVWEEAEPFVRWFCGDVDWVRYYP